MIRQMFIQTYENSVAQYSGKLAYVCGKHRISYGELDHQARCITAGLMHNGLTSGDRVALQVQSTSDFAACCIAVWRAGGVVQPLDTGLSASDLFSLLNIAPVSFLLGDKPAELLPTGIQALQVTLLKEHHPAESSTARQADEDAIILFSSGTTGKPKGIVHTHASMSEVIRRSVSVSGLEFTDVLLATSLSNTGFGIHSYVLEPLSCGATVVVNDPFHPRVALQIGHQEHVTWIQTVPAVLKLLLTVKNNQNLSALRSIRLGAATLDEQSSDKCLEKFGIEPIQGYGMSEIGRIACSTLSPQNSGGWMSVNKGIDLKIFTDDLTESTVNQAGEIGVRAGSLCRPYYLVQNEVHEPLTMNNSYFMTGDLGKVSDTGLLKLMGRRKRFILTPRYKVDPAEVEHVLQQHPEISEVAVIPVPGKNGYEIVKAVLVAKSPLMEAEIFTYCSNLLPQGKCPQIIEFIDQLPRNKLGKVEIAKISGGP